MITRQHCKNCILELDIFHLKTGRYLYLYLFTKMLTLCILYTNSDQYVTYVLDRAILPFLSNQNKLK